MIRRIQSTPMTVEELKTKLEDEDNDFCLHMYQRKAVYQALTQPLSLIQVYAYYTCIHTSMRSTLHDESAISLFCTTLGVTDAQSHTCYAVIANNICATTAKLPLITEPIK